MKPTRLLKTLSLSALMGALALTLTLPALAQKDGSDRKTKQTVAMSQKVYEKLIETQEFIEAKQYAEAEAGFAELQAMEKLSPYETAQIWNLTGYSYYLQERYSDAIRAYSVAKSISVAALESLTPSQDNYRHARQYQ